MVVLVSMSRLWAVADMMTDLSTLTALAQVATPGLWRVDCVKKAGEDSACFCGQDDEDSDEVKCKEPEKHLSPMADCYMIHGMKEVKQDEGWYYTKENAEFIAACSPDVILGLVQRVRELEEVLARLDAFTWKFVKDHGHDETEYTAWESVHYRAEHLLTPSEPRDVR